jgi:hypothetical protein
MKLKRIVQLQNVGADKMTILIRTLTKRSVKLGKGKKR